MIGALCYYLGLVPWTVLAGVVALLIWPLPMRLRARWLALWNHGAIAWLGICCGVRYRVHGREHLPETAAVVLCKHQSAWEAIALPKLLPPQSWVLKRELLWLPFMGWALAIAGAIPIDRSQGTGALRKVLRDGQARLQRGLWVIIFPEGTRVAPGQKGNYARSGAQLAVRANCPIVPIAHNAGLFWPRGSLRKYRGRIDMVIGEPILPGDRSAAELTQLCESWIESETKRLLEAAVRESPQLAARYNPDPTTARSPR